jgi:hypothetical protein
MQDDATHTDHRNGATARLRRAACLAAAPIALGMLVTGCGGSSPTSGVASLGSHAQTTGSTAASSAGSSGSGESSPGSSAVAYAACSSPVFKAAVHDCESLIPGGVHGGGGSGSSHEAAP